MNTNGGMRHLRQKVNNADTKRALLNIDGKGQAHTESAVAKSTRPSVLDHLKRPVPPRSIDTVSYTHLDVYKRQV